MLPYLLWPLMELGWLGPRSSAETKARRKPAAGRGALFLLIGVSLAIQLVGVIVNYGAWDIYWQGVRTAFPNYKNALSTSPLLTDIWLVPMSLYYTVTARKPVGGFAPANYPFGPPLPTNPGVPRVLNPFSLNYFWFTLLPHHTVWMIGGAVVFGGGMVLAGWLLLRRLRDVSPPHPVFASKPVEEVAKVANS